jgi:DNA-binding NarL/FixJ family response regulator
MSRSPRQVFVTADTGLLGHWQRTFKRGASVVLSDFTELLQTDASVTTVIWLDLSLADVLHWHHPSWAKLLQTKKLKVIATSSNPKDSEAIQALDAGCSGYCHAFSDAATLLQVKQVVEAGHIWIGKTLMHRLIQNASTAAVREPVAADDWSDGLSPREREVAIFAANGASNHDIARDCKISERTVKAHLSAVFDKLNLTDRLQLALRVHGIH